MTLSEGILVAIIGAIFGLLGSLASTFLQGWKWKTGEQPRSAADAAGSLTNTSLSLVTALRLEMSDLRKEVVEVRTENKELRDKMQEFEDVKDWVERLVHQVRSLGAEPVKMRTKRAIL